MNGKRRKKTTRILTCSENADDTDEDDADVECYHTSVYFHAEVTKKTILKFMKKMREAAQNAAQYCGPGEEARVFVYLHSGGGDVFSAISGMNVIRNCPCAVVTIVDGFCGSAATLMLLASPTRYITRYSQVLIHQIRIFGLSGKYCELQDEMKNTTDIMHTFEQIYLAETKLSREKLEELLNAESYLTTEDCISFGIVERII